MIGCDAARDSQFEYIEHLRKVGAEVAIPSLANVG